MIATDVSNDYVQSLKGVVLSQGIRSFTEACVRLDLAVQRDILLRNLNHLCISLDDSDILSDDGSTTSGT